MHALPVVLKVSELLRSELLQLAFCVLLKHAVELLWLLSGADNVIFFVGVILSVRGFIGFVDLADRLASLLPTFAGPCVSRRWRIRFAIRSFAADQCHIVSAVLSAVTLDATVPTPYEPLVVGLLSCCNAWTV